MKQSEMGKFLRFVLDDESLFRLRLSNGFSKLIEKHNDSPIRNANLSNALPTERADLCY